MKIQIATELRKVIQVELNLDGQYTKRGMSTEGTFIYKQSHVLLHGGKPKTYYMYLTEYTT